MNFFESQLRRLFGDTEDARFIGRCCFIPADDGNLVKAEFVTQGVHEEYVALQMSVINRADGVIDKTLLRFGDYLFSYSNKQIEGKKFQYKDFEKTKSYNSTFKDTAFIGTSFRAAQFKYCTFINCDFVESDFVGTNFRGTKFINCSFDKCLFQSTNCEGTGFKNCKYNCCYLNGNSVDCFKCLSGITVINLKKTQLNVLPELVKEIENLRTNDFVRRSNTLHLKQSKINMVTLFVLLQDYSQEDLINLIPRIPAYIDRDFYTISYLKRLLKKAMKGDTI